MRLQGEWFAHEVKTFSSLAQIVVSYTPAELTQCAIDGELF